MQKMFNTDSRHISWLYLFLGGFLAGTFIINIGRNSFLGNMELFNAASVSRLKYLDVDYGTFFGYVLKERLGMTLFLCLMATTYIGIIAIALYAASMGLMAGIFLSAASIEYGAKGIFLVAAGVLPQYIFLVPACIMLMKWCCYLCITLYFPNRNSEMYYGNKKQYILKKMIELFIILGVVIIGCLLESYVNPILIKSFLKIF